MKKILYILLIIFICISCSHKSQSTVKTLEDSTVWVYGFAKLPIDSAVKMSYKEFQAYKDSFAPIYDNTAKCIVFMRNKCSYKYGEWYVSDTGDTLFCVEDGYAKYVSAKEWHEYYERFK